MISVDTWRAEVGREVCRAGADLLNDAWGGFDPALAEVAAEYGAALVCTHTNGATPRTPPHRPSYDDVVRRRDRGHRRARRAGGLARACDPGSVLIDPAHDFDKNTWHSLEVTRRLDEMVATGWPVLVSLSNKDFVGETLDRPVGGAARRDARRDRGQRLARRPGLPGPRGRRDPAGARHGREHPWLAAARRVVRGLRVILAAALCRTRRCCSASSAAPATRWPTCGPRPSARSARRPPAPTGWSWWSAAADEAARRGTPTLPADVRRFGRGPDRAPSGAPPARCRSGSARRLLRDAGWSGPVELVSIALATPRRRGRALAGALAARMHAHRRCCCSATAAPGAGTRRPGYLDERAFGFDDAVARRWPPATRRRWPRSTPGWPPS